MFALPWLANLAAKSTLNKTKAYTRVASTAASMASMELHIKEPGMPPGALEHRKIQVPKCGPDQIDVRMLAAPINPSDIMTVQGLYPIQPSDGVPGHEGVGEVLTTGANVTSVTAGDHVVPLVSALGTWRTRGVWAADDWMKVPKDLSLPDAATLCINPGTALSMLTLFEKLEPNDVIALNGANSSVGRYILQIAKHNGWRTLALLRDRATWDADADALRVLGATLVVRPEGARDAVSGNKAKLPKAHLALDCVAGESGSLLAKLLRPHGTLVNYGVMGKAPLAIPGPLLIFADIKVRGFWMSGNSGGSGAGPTKAERCDLLQQLVGLIQKGVIAGGDDFMEWPFEDWHRALETSLTKERREKKMLLRMPNGRVL